MKKNNELQCDLRFKVWFEIGGHPVIGDGRLAMLNSIHQNGSIIEAARKMGISYRKIRGALSDMERHIGQPLVKAYRGGEHGGGADLTPAGHQLIDLYTKVKDSFEQDISTHQQEAAVLLKSLLSKNLQPNGKFCPSEQKGITLHEIF
ncbi:MAG: LysR family transcriptional regulator [Desulfamplus sp.]|nr:LysR family transcriptional regulator [Desulfamplus sp.]